MMIYNWNKMRYERVGDTNPDLLAEKLEMEAYDYGDYDDDNDDDYDF